MQPGDMIIEATSGNTGIAFAAIGRILGHPVKILMPDWLGVERHQLIKSLGAEVELVSKEQGGILGSIRMTEIASRAGYVFLPAQFENRFNIEAHEKTTGPEIWLDLQGMNLVPDAFVAGVGTGGTVIGVGNYLRTCNPSVRIHPLEPAESLTLSTGIKVGSHRIQGISDEIIPEIVQLDKLEGMLQASDVDAILMALRMASELGLAVGISSGANLLGAIRIQQEMGAMAVVATVLPDSNKKYLSTDLVFKIRPEPQYLSPKIELRGFMPVHRRR
ncbi:MAG: PLP-dependent cysteine synthase family protein [Mucilaginibacter sp.]